MCLYGWPQHTTAYSRWLTPGGRLHGLNPRCPAIFSCVPKPSPAADPALATVLRRLRSERGESQEAIAYKAGLTAGSLTRIELGQSSPEWATIRRIAAALDVSLSELAAAVEVQEQG
jgi:DNA-binding XRE family transcriptional regulator